MTKLIIRDDHYNQLIACDARIETSSKSVHILLAETSDPLREATCKEVLTSIHQHLRLDNFPESWTWIVYSSLIIVNVYSGGELDVPSVFINSESYLKEVNSSEFKLYEDFIYQSRVKSYEVVDTKIPRPYNGPWDVWVIPTKMSIETQRAARIAEGLSRDDAEEHVYFEEVDAPSPDKGDYRKYVIVPTGTEPNYPKAISKVTPEMEEVIRVLEESLFATSDEENIS